MGGGTIAMTEGTLDFDYPAAGKPCKTWYRIYGELKNSSRPPLVTLHGGPGMASGYLWTLQDLAARYGVPVIRYDQLGCGRSTHLSEFKGNESFWTAELFIAELDNLLTKLGIQDNFDLFGQSWGGMLGSLYASRRPKGLRRLILSNSPGSISLFVESCNGLRGKLPQDVQDVLNKHEKDRTFEDPEYEKAVMVFYEHYMCRAKPFPEDLNIMLEEIKQDPTVYHTMNGPSEFTIIGSLKSWSTIEDSKNINVPTLLINGQHDEAQISCVTPFFQNIPKVRWITMDGCSHLPMYEDRDRYMEIIGDFLSE